MFYVPLTTLDAESVQRVVGALLVLQDATRTAQETLITQLGGVESVGDRISEDPDSMPEVKAALDAGDLGSMFQGALDRAIYGILGISISEETVEARIGPDLDSFLDSMFPPEAE